MIHLRYGTTNMVLCSGMKYKMASSGPALEMSGLYSLVSFLGFEMKTQITLLPVPGFTSNGFVMDDIMKGYSPKEFVKPNTMMKIGSKEFVKSDTMMEIGPKEFVEPDTMMEIGLNEFVELSSGMNLLLKFANNHKKYQ